jgi:hypothetical protein
MGWRSVDILRPSGRHDVTAARGGSLVIGSTGFVFIAKHKTDENAGLPLES